MRKLLRRIGIGLGVLAAVALLLTGGGLAWLRITLHRSLPRLDGEIALRGLAAPVTVQRDSLGVPVLRAENRLDLARATGFVHAQDRFFQMDLFRRQPAGELAALAGPWLLGVDRRMRIYSLRDVAERTYAALPAEERALLDAYADGVNAALAAMDARPFEYVAFRNAPEPWRPEDSLLSLLAMFADLHEEDGELDAHRTMLADALPESLAAFLCPPGTDWETPLTGGLFPDPPMPGPSVFDLRGADHAAAPLPPDPETEPRVERGSNAFAVAGAFTATGGALVANDMHLGLSVPNVWYRAAFEWKAADGTAHRAWGLTLPGMPMVVAGSNGAIAWGLTYTQGDWSDLVVLEAEPGDSLRYRTPEGPRALERTPAILAVHRGEPDTIVVERSVWGPVVDRDARGRRRSIRWTALDVGGVNLAAIGFETADSLGAAMDVAARSGVPGLNVIVADRSGRIGWTVAGRLPKRVGFDGKTAVSFADGSKRWDGYFAPEETPRVVDPETGRIWSANQRMVEGEDLRKIGDGGYEIGARGRQVRDDLLAVERATPEDLLRIQLDDRALFLERWQRLLLRVLSNDAVVGHPRRAELRDVVAGWGGRASRESAGYRMVRAWRLFVRTAVWEPFTRRCLAVDPRFNPRVLPNDEGPLWRLVTERPAHLLNPRYAAWDSLLLAAADSVLGRFDPGRPLAGETWGRFNRLGMQHPLSLAVPALARYLDMPSAPMPGDTRLPRVQTPEFGASERFGVSPGREAEGYFHLPGGQSGHPLSPYYRRGHDAWVEGRPTPFLPGPPEHTLRLVPGE